MLYRISFKRYIRAMHGSRNTNHVTWSNSYSVGIPLIDEQHKGLLNLVNDLFAHSTGNEREERAYFTDVIHEMIRYVKEHFSTEEKYLLAYKFPEYAEHKKAHDSFTMEVINSAKDFEAGKRLVLVKLARFLRDWILSHIGVMDLRYAAYFREIATRKADGRLSVARSDIK